MITFKYRVNNDNILEGLHESLDVEESYRYLEKLLDSMKSTGYSKVQYLETGEYYLDKEEYERPITPNSAGITRESHLFSDLLNFNIAMKTKTVKSRMVIRKLKRYSEVNITFTW